MQIFNQLTNNFPLKKHVAITFSGALFGFSIAYFIVTGDATNSDESLDTLSGLLSVCIGVSSAYWIYVTARYLDRWLPWHKQEGNRLLTGIFVHFVLTFAWSVFILYISSLLFKNDFDFIVIQETYLVKLGILLLILILFIEIIYFALYSYDSYTKFHIETVRQERKQIELQLKALKSQLSPHFLFNSLNTISSLVFKDKTKAEGFIRKLAEMYQYTLKSYQTKLITLQEELNFLDSYQYLLKTRFGDKFQCTIRVDEDFLQTKIPPLTLQMLLENAVKHNVLSEENPLRIEVTAHAKYISIRNNITKKPTKVSSFQIGLKNINARYLLLHKQGIAIQNGEYFQVKIPVIL